MGYKRRKAERLQAIALVRQGHPLNDVASKFGVTPDRVEEWVDNADTLATEAMVGQPPAYYPDPAYDEWVLRRDAAEKTLYDKDVVPYSKRNPDPIQRDYRRGLEERQRFQRAQD